MKNGTPNTQEAHSLYNYAQSADFDSCGTDNTTEYNNQTVDLDSIDTVYSVTELKTKQVNQEGARVICAIIYAFPTLLNLDADVNLVVAVRCSNCHFRVDSISGTCVNRDCPLGSVSMINVTETQTDTMFDMRVTVSDHTGSIHNCYLSGDVAESMLGCKVAEFLCFDEDQKTSLKWRFLLERCKMYINISQLSFEQQRPISRILQCSLAEPQQAAAALH
ncbi:Meiosis-specific with OB domain-containing protein [Lamellibrachia satsuma]|nr:Meiosis-specific with OB domain-containing protein [Lamellibrachia satsuma]